MYFNICDRQLSRGRSVSIVATIRSESVSFSAPQRQQFFPFVQSQYWEPFH